MRDNVITPNKMSTLIAAKCLIYDADVTNASNMRILVDMPSEQVRELARISAATKRPRAAIIRDAVADYLTRQESSTMRDAFGIWGDLQIDSVEYQRKLRDEW